MNSDHRKLSFDELCAVSGGNIIDLGHTFMQAIREVVAVQTASTP